MRWFLLVGFVGVALQLGARPGVVHTADGRTLTGDVSLTNGSLLVSPTNSAAVSLGPTQVVSATFDRPDLATPAAGAAGTQGTGLFGCYFANLSFDGNVMVRLDETVDFDWGESEPVPGVPSDRFGVLWMGEVEAPATGAFQFSIVSDDGGRLFLAEQQVVDAWSRRGIETSSGLIPLQAGVKYPIKFMYQEAQGKARARLFWTGPGMPKSIVPKERLFAQSVLPNHRCSISGDHGLLGTYYKTVDFGGESFTRIDPTIDFTWMDREPAPGFDRTSFSARWLGQVQAEHSEEYTFHVTTGDRVRLWVDDKLLIDRPEQTWLGENRESMALTAGERYDIRLETRSGSNGGAARLAWSSASTPKAPIPAARLFPSKPSVSQPGLLAGEEKTPPGVLLRSGTFVAGVTEQASETSIRVSGLLRETSLTTVNVARIVCQPLSTVLAARIPSGRAGLLLAKGDFVEADFRRLENDRVYVSSVLFGARSYDARKEVMAVVLRATTETRAPYEVQLLDRSRLAVSEVGFEPEFLVTRDALLGTVKIPIAQLMAFKRRISPASGVSR